MKSKLRTTLLLMAGVLVALSGQSAQAQDLRAGITKGIMSAIGTESMRTAVNTVVREFAHNPGLRKQLLQSLPPDVVTALTKSMAQELADNPSLRRQVFQSLPNKLRVQLISTGRNSANGEIKVASITGNAQGGFTRPRAEPAAMEAPLEDPDQSASSESELNAFDSIVTITHSSNPVRRLSTSQLRKIATGDYTNWNQLGGSDQPINVFTVPPVRQILHDASNAPLTAKANVVAFRTVLIPSVGLDKSAIGFLQVENTDQMSFIRDLKSINVVSVTSTEPKLAANVINKD